MTAPVYKRFLLSTSSSFAFTSLGQKMSEKSDGLGARITPHGHWQYSSAMQWAHCHAMLCISAAIAVMRCPSVCPSVCHVRELRQNE